MKSYCNHCDPKHFNIHGFCGHCKRKCACPLYDPRSNMSLEDYAEYKKRWEEQDLDSILGGFGRQKT
jgi:hypothetical protein